MASQAPCTAKGRTPTRTRPDGRSCPYSLLANPGSIAATGFGLVAVFYLLREHTAHTLGALPYLLLLACPLMHLFMHHGHGGHHAGRSRDAVPNLPPGGAS